MNNKTSNLDELIEAEQKRHAEKIAKLKRAAAEEQRRVDERVIVLLRTKHSHTYEQLVVEAREALDAEKDRRSRKAKKSAQQPSTPPSIPIGGDATWNA